MSKKANTYHCYNLLYYTPKLWEKIVLFFCPLEQHDADTATVWYKRFGHRLYVYGYIRVRVADSDTYTTGLNSTNRPESSTGFDNAGNN